MTVKTGSIWAGAFVTLDATGAIKTATGTPSGVLYIDGVANGATVTITGSNPYKWSVTLPALTAGQRVDMYITATISYIATAAIVASDQADTSLLSDGVAVASIATDAITAAALKADAVTEIQNGLALEATLTAIKGAGWTTETLKVIRDALTAAQADLDNPDQYKANVSGLATTIHVQEVENKVDLIDVTTVANSGKIDAVDAKVSAIDTDTVMSFMIDGFTFEQIVQIMASVLAGKLTRSGDTLTFRDLADTVNRVVAETDTNKQRTTMTYTV